MKYEEKAAFFSSMSSGQVFWRGFLWGLGRGVGSLLGWLALIAILFFLFQQSGIKDSYQELLDTVKQFQIPR